MQIKNLNFAAIKQLPIRKWTIIVFSHLPKVVLYIICLYLFYHNVSVLTEIYFSFNTTVLIKYNPANEMTFPAVTICSCTYLSATCMNLNSYEKMFNETTRIKNDNSVAAILNNISLPENYLVMSCYFVADSRRPANRKPCKDIQSPVASIQNGRKW